jgi:chemotaxis protein MotB
MAIKKFLKAAKELENQHRYRQKEEGHRQTGDHDEGNWLISYADMMTLLCGFFVMMFSMAKLDEAKYDSFKASITQQFGGNYQSPTKDLALFVSQVLQEAGVDQNTVVMSDPQGVSVVFQSTVFFDTLSADVKPGGQDVLNRLILGITSRQKDEKKKFKIVVEGHTDDRPILGGSFPSNWELSGARAARVVRMFLDRGYQSDHLTAIAYGDTRPSVPSRTPAGAWDESALAKNRRVVLRILRPTADAIPFAESATPMAVSAPTAAPPAAALPAAAPAPAVVPASPAH